MLTSVGVSLDSHLMAFAAEQARREKGKVIEVAEYEKEVRAGMTIPTSFCRA